MPAWGGGAQGLWKPSSAAPPPIPVVGSTAVQEANKPPPVTRSALRRGWGGTGHVLHGLILGDGHFMAHKAKTCSFSNAQEQVRPSIQHPRCWTE